MRSTVLLAAALTACSWLSAGVACAQDAKRETSLLFIGSNVDQVSGVRSRTAFQRHLRDGESGAWDNPLGHWDSAGVIVLAGGGMVGAIAGIAHAQLQRDHAIKPVRDAVAADDRLRDTVRDAALAAAARQGYPVTGVFFADTLSKAHVQRQLEGVYASGDAVTLSGAGRLAPISLGWDDRQPILSFRASRYRKVRGKRLSLRDVGRQVDIRYLGLPAPSATAPQPYWAENGGKRFLDEVDYGAARVFDLAFGPSLEPLKVKRKETVVLQVGGRAETFTGRLWKQEGDVAYLYTPGRTITLVRVDAL